MKVVCLGGAGAMGSSCVYDLHKTSDFDEIVVADFDEGAARRVINLMDGDKRFSYVRVDASKKDEIANVLRVLTMLSIPCLITTYTTSWMQSGK